MLFYHHFLDEEFLKRLEKEETTSKELELESIMAEIWKDSDSRLINRIAKIKKK